MEDIDSPELASKHGRPRRWKRWVLAIVVLLGIVVLLAGLKVSQIKTMIDAGKSMTPPPESVGSAKVEQVEWQPMRAAVGTLVAFRGVILSAEVTGTVREIDFQNGTAVKKGQVLVRLDTSNEQALLQSATAEASLAKQMLARAMNLRKNGVNTQSDLDAAMARDTQARAQVANLEATINKKVIRAPFDGRVGIRAVELGQVVNPGTAIVSLQTVSPIYAEFQLPQQALAAVKLGQAVLIAVDVFPKASWQGTVTTIDPQVDPSTRNVRIRATVENPDGRLVPGMFANVSVESGAKQQVLIVPATAILYAPYGDSVYVVEPPKEPKAPSIAKQRFIRLGERRGDFVEVLSGLSAGETVVSAGAFKLRNGQAVSINNAIAPTPELAPKPTER